MTARHSQKVHVCPIDRCSEAFIEEDSLRDHASRSTEGDHRGMTLDDFLNPIEKYKFEDLLRDQYVSKERTQQEIADHWGISRNTVYRWLNEHGIPRRDTRGKNSNRVEYASFYTECHRSGGYVRVGSYNPESQRMDWTRVHQLIAIAEGASPAKVFSNGRYHCHHKNGIPWDNRSENINFLPRRQHLFEHGIKGNMSTSEYLYGEWGHPDWNPTVRGSETLPDDL